MHVNKKSKNISYNASDNDMQLLFFSETNLSDIYAFNWTYLTERQQG
jgi:hypothetical protein